MRRSKLLFSSILATVLGMGVIGGVAVTRNTNNVRKVEAESWVHNPTVYFVPSNNWAKDNAAFKMNFYDGGTYKGVVNMTLEGTGAAKGLFYNRKVFKGVVTGDYWPSRIQILRFNSTYSSQWNYSGTIYLSDNNSSPVLMMDSDKTFGNDWTTSTDGVWWNADNDYSVYKTTDYSPSSSTGRVFFNNSGTHWADNSGTNKGCAVYAWGGSASPKKWTSGDTVFSATVYHLTWFNDDNGMSYGYADIPLNCTGYKFVRTTVADEYTTSLGYFSDNSFNIDSFAYVRFGRTSGNYIDSGGAKDDVAGANLMKKVIEAYDTCSSSVLNGYGAYSALNTNFYSHATAAAKSATHTSLNGTSATIQAHFEGMASRPSGGRSLLSRFALFGNSSMDISSASIIIIASVLSVSAIGGYFLIRRKKQK